MPALDLFKKPWDSLALSDVEAFLHGADDEPLVWEAKGTTVDANHVRKAVGAFANSHDGGYLILGAIRAESEWSLEGIELPDEPQVWVSNVISDGLRPSPRHDIRPFPVGSNRHLIVVKVDPLPDPPCLARGTVYERVPGKSVPVKDPQRLADLYRRGEHAHTTARQSVERATHAALQLAEITPSAPGIAVGIAPVGAVRQDVARVLFAEPFWQRLIALTKPIVAHRSVPLSGETTPHIGQDFVAVHGIQVSRDFELWARAAWDGTASVAICPEDTDDHDHVSLAARDLERCLMPAYEIVEALGATESAFYVNVRVVGPAWRRSIDSAESQSDTAVLRRGPLTGAPDDNLIADFTSELHRIQGRFPLESF